MINIFALDDFFLDRVCQPIGDWSHQRFGIHPQQIAEFFALGAIIVVLAENIIDYLKQPSFVSVPVALLSLSIPLLWYYIIRRPARIVGGRNPKRYRWVFMRIMYFVFAIWFAISATRISHLLLASSDAFIWLGLSFAALDEPPPREYRKSIFSWAT